jgi:hypothetical protein
MVPFDTKPAQDYIGKRKEKEMAYFQTSQAQYRAERLAQLLTTPDTVLLGATPDGRMIANMNGRIFLFALDREGNVELRQKVDIKSVENEPTVMEIVGQ